MQKLRLYLPMAGGLMLIFTGCMSQVQAPTENPHLAAGTQNGSFCQRLAHVLVRGTERGQNKGYFGALAGQRIDDDRFYGTVNLGGATECVVDTGMGKYDVDYVCYYGQADEAQRGVLVKKMNELEAAIDECLVQKNTFTVYQQGVPKTRYFTMGHESDGITFYDRWRHQSVKLKIEPVEQDESLSELTLTIDSL